MAKHRVQPYLSEETHLRLKAYAERRGLTLSAAATELIAAWCEKEERRASEAPA